MSNQNRILLGDDTTIVIEAVTMFNQNDDGYLDITVCNYIGVNMIFLNDRNDGFLGRRNRTLWWKHYDLWNSTWQNQGGWMY